MTKNATPTGNAAFRGARLMFIAGEPSGDNHSAAVIREIKARRPDAEIFGAGGPKMRDAGMELIVDLTEHAVVGIVEAFKNYGTFKRIFHQLIAEAERRKPDAVILTDYPGFNLRFAAQMKRRGIKVIYFISPQVWAWHASRAKQIERDVDLLLTIFPFEKAWFAEHAPKLRVEFVGHPFADEVSANPKSEIRNPKLVLLLPGSREREVAKIFPVMAAAIEKMPSDVKFIAAAVNEKTAAMMKHPRVEVQIDKAHELMQRATLAITASGTATMECAFHGCPMVVVYKVNWLTYLLGRMLVKVNWIAMPNVIAGREIVREFIQHDATPEAVAAAAKELLASNEKTEQVKVELSKVIASLGERGASARAAELILSECHKGSATSAPN
jgi:lipid-A-disaccharide synthase